MARRRYTTRVSRDTRRKFVWGRFTVNQTIQPAQVVRYDLMDDFNTRYGADLLGATVVRIRGGMQVRSTNPGEELIWTAIVQPDSGDPNIGPDEGPIQNAFADWMMVEPFATSGPNADSVTAARLVDCQASRKMEELGESLFGYAAAPAGNVGNLEFWAYLSIGLKLP